VQSASSVRQPFAAAIPESPVELDDVAALAELRRLHAEADALGRAGECRVFGCAI